MRTTRTPLLSLSLRVLAVAAIVSVAVSLLPASTAHGAATDVVLTSGSSWSVPAGVTSVKIWAIGAGGGGAGATSVDGTSGGGGGAGEVVVTTVSVSGGSISYALGIGGAGGINSANGSAGGNTTVSYGSNTVTAHGGGAGIYNTNATGAGGTGGGGTMGGTGAGAAGDTGGGGGGGIGTAAGTANGAAGGTGGQSIDVNGLRAAVTSASYSWTGPGVGPGSGNSSSNNMNGTSATGFGSGGGGAGYYGGGGGAGYYGGGGGGAAGYTAANMRGGAGGAGAVVLEYTQGAAPTGYTIASPGFATMYLYDDDTPPASVLGSFTASPVRVKEGQSATLSWTIAGMTDCAIDNGIGAVNATDGTHSVATPAIATRTTFTLTCADGTGSSASTVDVGIVPIFMEQ